MAGERVHQVLQHDQDVIAVLQLACPLLHLLLVGRELGDDRWPHVGAQHIGKVERAPARRLVELALEPR